MILPSGIPPLTINLDTGATVLGATLDIFGRTNVVSGAVNNQLIYSTVRWTTGPERLADVLEGNGNKSTYLYNSSGNIIQSFTFNIDGNITSSSRGTFWNSDNFNPNTKANLSGATFTGGVAITGNFGTWTVGGWGVSIRVQTGHALQLNTSGGITYGLGQSGDGFYIARALNNTSTSAVTYPLFLNSTGGLINGATIWTSNNLVNPFSGSQTWDAIGSTVWAFATGALVGIGGAKAGSELSVGGTSPSGTWIHVGNFNNLASAGDGNAASMWRRIA
jgi:hypothetical protein